MKLKAVPFVPGKTCNYCGRTRYEARKDGPCPGPWGCHTWPGEHSWIMLEVNRREMQAEIADLQRQLREAQEDRK